MTDENRFTLTEEQLFERLVKLETDKLVLAQDIKQLKTDAKFDEDENPKGLDRELISLVHAVAKLEAKQNYEEVAYKNAAIAAKFKELTHYDD